MAERRMFAKTIIDSDAFLDMPASARLLYYDLSMRADDDGFVNSPKKIARMTGATLQDIQVLIANKFVIPFENKGVIVIKHWFIHNYIRKDTYSETPYKEEKALLEQDENKAYRVRRDDVVTVPSTESRRAVDGPSTQVRLGKDRVGNSNNIAQNESDFERFWKAYPRKVGKAAAQKAFKKVSVSTDVLIGAIEKQKQSKQWAKDGGQFIPYPATWLNRGGWADELEPETQGTYSGFDDDVHSQIAHYMEGIKF